MNSLDLSELLTLIKLLKAEGVKEYSNHGLHLQFHSEVHAAPEGSGRPGQEGPPQEEATPGADAEATQVTSGHLAEVVPERLKKLNPNYRKLIEVTTRG